MKYKLLECWRYYTLPFLLACLFVLQPKTITGQNLEPWEEPPVREESPVRVFMGPAIKLMTYESFSQTKPSFPFRAGYPSLVSTQPAFELQIHANRKNSGHHFELTGALPGKLASNNGLKQDYLLGDGNNYFYRYQLKYYLSTKLFQVGETKFVHGVTLSALYEARELFYRSGQIDYQWDAGLGMGPALGFSVPVGQRMVINGKGHFVFYLPWLGAGNWKTTLPDDQSISSFYYPFTYATTWELNMGLLVQENFRVLLGYRKNDQVGVGNAFPSFKVNELVSYKLDRMHEFFIGFSINVLSHESLR